MSSTNHGATRNEADFYPTPISAFLPLIPFIPKLSIWEPACGDKRLINCLNSHGFSADGDDLNEGYDFLKSNRPHACIVTNPPFSLAFEFCKHALSCSSDVFLLLRLNFLASQKRQQWFREHEPSALFVLSKRPSFCKGKTDSCDYAFYYWGTLHHGIFHL